MTRRRPRAGATRPRLAKTHMPQRGVPDPMAHDPHAGHEHFPCSCGKQFHSRQELTDHARRLNHKPA